MKTLLLNLWAWVASDPLYALGAVLVGLVAMWKALPAKHRAAIELRYPRPVGLVRTLVALLPDLIGAARVMRYQTVAGQPRAIVSDRAVAEAERLRAALAPEPAPERETIAPDASGPRSSAGFADLRTLAAIAGTVAVLVLPALALTGCPMPAPDGCSPGSRRCHEDTPQVCSPGQRWTPADVTCSTVNATCVVRDGVPACLRGEQ